MAAPQVNGFMASQGSLEQAMQQQLLAQQLLRQQQMQAVQAVQNATRQTVLGSPTAVMMNGQVQGVQVYPQMQAMNVSPTQFAATQAQQMWQQAAQTISPTQAMQAAALQQMQQNFQNAVNSAPSSPQHQQPQPQALQQVQTQQMQVQVQQPQPPTPTSAKKRGKGQPRSPAAAFVHGGWLYPAGMNRKLRRAILFEGQPGNGVSLEGIQRVWVGKQVADGVVGDDKVPSPEQPAETPTSTRSYQGLTPSTTPTSSAFADSFFWARKSSSRSEGLTTASAEPAADAEQDAPALLDEALEPEAGVESLPSSASLLQVPAPVYGCNDSGEIGAAVLSPLLATLQAIEFNEDSPAPTVKVQMPSIATSLEGVWGAQAEDEAQASPLAASRMWASFNTEASSAGEDVAQPADAASAGPKMSLSERRMAKAAQDGAKNKVPAMLDPTLVGQ